MTYEVDGYEKHIEASNPEAAVRIVLYRRYGQSQQLDTITRVREDGTRRPGWYQVNATYNEYTSQYYVREVK